jgi:hypothetical protein
LSNRFYCTFSLSGVINNHSLGEPMTRGVEPKLLSADERIAEIADILAAGLMRLHARKSSPFSANTGDSSLDCPAHQSGHAKPEIHGDWHG